MQAQNPQLAAALGDGPFQCLGDVAECNVRARFSTGRSAHLQAKMTRCMAGRLSTQWVPTSARARAMGHAWGLFRQQVLPSDRSDALTDRTCESQARDPRASYQLLAAEANIRMAAP